MSLAQQFAIASFLVLVLGMIGLGWWVSETIEAGVTQNTAVTTALYMNSFVAPEIQELARQDSLLPESRATLDRLHRDTPLGKRIVSFKIWGPGGRVVYSSEPSLIGREYPIGANQKRAWQGFVISEISRLEEEEQVFERTLAPRLLEIYSPVREKESDRIIAVAEFYGSADDLEGQLLEANIDSWLVVACATLGMFGLLFGIVRRGSETIARQQRELRGRVEELSSLLEQNEELNERVRKATRRAIEVNERFLRRVSAELHDGPAQALGFALLRLDSVMEGVNASPGGKPKGARGSRDWDVIRHSLHEALREIRNVSADLALPELAELSLSQSLRRMVRAHEHRTGTEVELGIGDVPDKLPLPSMIGLCRFVQEALSNAYRHAGGRRQRVDARCTGGVLQIDVVDGGPGFDPSAHPVTSNHLGLIGMRERIESLGGIFDLDSAPGRGTRVTARMPLPVMEESDDV